MDAASRAAFEFSMWIAETKDADSTTTKARFLQAAFEAGYKAGMAVALEPHCDEDIEYDAALADISAYTS